MKGRGRRGLKNYHAALRAIKAKHKGATHRDAQVVYRKLVKLTGGKVSARQVSTARPATTRKLLRQARRQGSRTSPRTKAQKQKQARLARKFAEKQAKQRKRRGATKTRKARKPKGKASGPEKPRGPLVGGSSRGRAPVEESDDEGGAFGAGEEIDAAEWDRRFDAADAGDLVDVDEEIESSADYGATT